MINRTAKIFLTLASTFVFLFSYTATRIYIFGTGSSDVQADAAVVLGAAVWSNQLSPVFRERINHAIDLYRKGKVKKLVFTGGQGNKSEPTEAAAARDYALSNGVPRSDMLLEENSHTTFENIFFAKQLTEQHGLKKVLLVSDPIHMKRAITMAHDLGFEAYPSPTPTTRYTGWRSQLGELTRETFYYVGYQAGSIIHRKP